MGKRIYISADYDEEDGDKDVIDELNKWVKDNKHSLDFTDMAQVVSGSVSHNNPDCRPCDLKREFNQQINQSSIVVFIVGNKTKYRKSGSQCGLINRTYHCTPYKYNVNGSKICNHSSYQSFYQKDVDEVNDNSYLQHEFEQAKYKNKKIVIFYNSTRYESDWLPSYMHGYENCAVPFWKINSYYGYKVGDYETIKRVLGYE